MLKNISLDQMAKVLYHAILGSVADPFSLIDREYRVLWVNRDGPQDQWVGQQCHLAYQGIEKPCEDCPVKRVFDTGRGCVLEKWVPLRDGTRIWGEIRAYPVTDRTGETVSALKIGHDLTLRKHEQDRQKSRVQALEEAIVDLLNSRNPAADWSGGPPPGGLSRREMGVLKLMADGRTNPEIANLLDISPHTVKSHVISIFNKLGVSDRTRAAVRAARLNLI